MLPVVTESKTFWQNMLPVVTEDKTGGAVTEGLNFPFYVKVFS